MKMNFDKLKIYNNDITFLSIIKHHKKQIYKSTNM